MVTYIKDDIYLNDLCNEMRDICKFGSEQSFTMKWVDEEGIHSFLTFKPLHRFFKI